MKRLFAIVLLLATSVVAQAQGKIAVVDLERAILNTDAAKAKMAEVEADADFKRLIEDGQKAQAEFIKLNEEYQKESVTMSPDQVQALQAKIKSKKSDLEHMNRKLQETQASILGLLMREMQVDALKAAKAIIEAEGIGLLLNKGRAQQPVVLHADTSFDITAKVTDKLNKANKTK